MKNTLLLSTLLIVCHHLLGQTKTDTIFYDETFGQKRIKTITVTNNERQNITYFYENGNKEEEYTEQNNLLDGKYTLYNEDGTIRRQATYKMGSRHGLETVYFNNKKIESQIFYENGHKIGPFAHWNEKGILISKGEYDTIKVKNYELYDIKVVYTGKLETFFETGKRKELSTYKKGKFNGLSEEWYPNGNQKSKIAYLNGKNYGIKMEWFENGNLKEKCNYYVQYDSNGVYIKSWYDGERLKFYPNGKVSEVENYQNYVRNGKWITYAPDGKKASEATYTNGLLCGSLIRYYSNETPSEIINFKCFLINSKYESMKDGVSLKCYENGNTKEIASYVQDKLRGMKYAYFASGKLWYESVYVGTYENSYTLKYYDETGKLLSESIIQVDSSFSEQVKYLNHTYLHKNGKLGHKVDYVNFEPIGLSQFYFDSGILSSQSFLFKKAVEYNISWKADYYPNGTLKSENLIWRKSNYGDQIEWYPDGKLKRFLFGNGLDIYWLQSGELMSSSITKQLIPKDTIINPAFLEDLYNTVSNNTRRQINILDTIDGIQTSYYTNNKIRFQTKRKGNCLDSFFIAYSFSGDTLFYTEIDNGQLHGKYLRKHINGKYIVKGEHTNNRESGIWWHFNGAGNGKLEEYSVYDTINKDNMYKESYYNNGALKMKRYYTNGLKNGWSTIYHQNGKIQGIGVYVMDTICGKHMYYYKNGKLCRIVNYTNGQKNGIHQTWFELCNKQQVSTIENYTNDILDGEALYYYKNGKLKLKAFYKNGLKDGVWQYYHSNGKLNYTITYIKGKKQLKPLSGQCDCRENSSYDFLGPDVTDLKEFQTPQSLYHEPINKQLKHFKFRPGFSNLLSINNYDIITPIEIKIGIPDKKGLQLILNSCWQLGDVSQFAVRFSDEEYFPENKWILIRDLEFGIVLPPKIIKPMLNNRTKVLARFDLYSILYTKDSILFEGGLYNEDGEADVCVEKAYLLDKKYIMQINKLSLRDIRGEQFDFDKYMVDCNDKTAVNKLKRFYKHEMILINNGEAELELSFNNHKIKSQVSKMLITQKVVSGLITIDSLAKQTPNNVLFPEKIIINQMKKDGFRILNSDYNLTEDKLQIWFAIK